jgi:hypothetical protein
VPVTPAQFVALNSTEVSDFGFVAQEEIDEGAERFPHLFPTPPPAPLEELPGDPDLP